MTAENVGEPEAWRQPVCAASMRPRPMTAENILPVVEVRLPPNRLQ